MKKIKSILAIITVFSMIFGLTACGSNTPKEPSDTAAAESRTAAVETTSTAESESKSSDSVSVESISSEGGTSETTFSEAGSAGEGTVARSNVLIAYFSATGTTKGVAERIANVTGGDLYEILAAEPYSDEDLNYNDNSSRSTQEQNDKSVRPEIGSEDLSLEGYTTIYLGFPIWWGEEPRILDTFVEKYDFEGITVIPFCTSGGSGIGRSGANMEELAGSGTWLEGRRFSGNVSKADLLSWIDELK